MVKTFNFTINFSNRVFYTLIVIFSFSIIFGVYVFAFNPSGAGGDPAIVGHSVDELNLGPILINSTTNKVEFAGEISTGGNLNVGGSVRVGGDSSDCNSLKAGFMRWTGSNFEGCDGSSWKILGNSSTTPSPPIYDLVNGWHSSTQCTNAGGTVMTDGADKFCRFNVADCRTLPDGWVEYKLWSATSVKTCNAGNCPTPCNSGGQTCCVGSCTTGSHVFSNTAQETCNYKSSECYSYDWGTCIPNSGPNICTSTYTARGCY